MCYQRSFEERRVSRILEIISGILDGGEGVGKGLGRLWSGSNIYRIFLENFLEWERAYSCSCVSSGCVYYFLLSTVAWRALPRRTWALNGTVPGTRSFICAANSPSYVWFTYARFTENEWGSYVSSSRVPPW